MNHRKSSRNRHKKSSQDENSQMMRVYKLNRAAAASEIHGTSIYEIDIKSSVNFYNDTVDNPLVKVCIANVAPVALEKKNTGKGVELNVVENPFIKSHYPRFRETDSESERKLPNAEKTDHMIQTSLSSDTQNGEAHDFFKKQNFFDKEKEGNQSEAPDSLSKLKKEVKKQIFQGFLAKADSARTLSTHSSAGNTENELLHLHHHEHHHHYHFDKKRQRDVDDSILHLSKPSSCESREALIGGRKRFSRRRQTFDEDSPKCTYFYTCESKSRVLITADADAFLDQEKANRGQKPKPSCSAKTFRSRTSSSSESIRNKKSYLLKSHNYSDTDMAMCDSDISVSDMFRLDVLKKKDSKTNYSFVNTTKRFGNKSSNHNKETPWEAMDQKSDTKAIYLKEASDTTIVYTEEETIPQNIAAEETEKRDSDTIPFTVKRGNEGSLDTEPVQTWAEKIKAELREIKRTLGVIEKEFQKKKIVMYADINDTKSKSEDGSGHEISVFSSRTFILRAENLYVIEESDNGALGGNIQSFFENDEICYAETERGHFFLSPNGSWLHFKSEEKEQKNIWKAEPVKA